MRAVVLAAGQGTRLMPFTADRPKCMVALAGRPLLDHLLASLRLAGVGHVTVVTGYRAEALVAPGCDTVPNPAYATTNMVTSLFAAVAGMPDGGDLLVSYSDCVYEPRVVRAVLEEERGDVVVATDIAWLRLWSRRMPDPLRDAETFKMDRDGRISELGRKPQGYADIAGQYMGLFKIRGSRVADLKRFYAGLDRRAAYDGQSFGGMYMTSFLQELIDAGWHLQAAPTRGGWLEVDSTADLQLYEALHEAGKLSELCALSGERRPGG